MDFNLTHETICVSEPIFDDSMEQSVELDYALPDYYPSIFKLLKCRIIPCVYACRTAGDKLVVDGVNIVKLIYVCEDQNRIHSIEQKIPFSKTADMKAESENAIISYETRCDFVNCRVVNPRRVDLRGAITIHVTVCNQTEQSVVCDAQGAGVQLNRSNVCVGGEHLWATKQFSVSEEVQVGNLPPVGEVLTIEACAASQECKLIANKAVTKGEAHLHILYSSNEEEPTAHRIQTSFPISQIVDMPGVDEDYSCMADYKVTSCEYTLGEDGTSINVELDITVCCEAYLNKTMNSVDDAFSTQFDLDIQSRDFRTEKLVCMFSSPVELDQSFDLPGISEVVDTIYSIDNVTGKVNTPGKITFTGDLSLLVLGFDNEGNPTSTDKTSTVEFEINQEVPCDEPVIRASVCPVDLEFSLEGGQLQVKLKFEVSGKILCIKKWHCITDLQPNEEKPKSRCCGALTLYYPDSGESIWDIAKRYNTSLAAILEENGLENVQTLPGNGMILIPIVE